MYKVGDDRSFYEYFSKNSNKFKDARGKKPHTSNT